MAENSLLLGVPVLKNKLFFQTTLTEPPLRELKTILSPLASSLI